MSRPARAGSAGKPVTIRATDAERERWEAAAICQRLSLSDMLREQANSLASHLERNATPGLWSSALRSVRRKRKR